MINIFIIICCFIFLTSCQSSSKVNFTRTVQFDIEQDQLINHFQQLSSKTYQGRNTSTQGNIKAQQYIKSYLSKISAVPFNNKYLHNFQIKNLFSNRIGSNVIALIEGVAQNNEYIVLTAHYDHLGTKAKKVFNGADDNASGTAALLSIAEMLVKKPINHNVIILFTDAEESNLKGSKAFINQNPNLIGNIKLNINLDMLAGSDKSKNLYYIYRGLQTLLPDTKLKKFNSNHYYKNISVFKGFKRTKHYLNKRTNWLLASDHSAFHKQGIPFVYYGVGIHDNYHTSNDTFSNSNKELLIKSTNIIFQQLLFLDKFI
ncbi:MAG: M28 family peptidase [Colwelliaceae bacterium]|nr:M28 family peptidase [Colwelliaceae bacterium]